MGLDATLDFSSDTDTGDSSVTYTITQTHSGCMVQGAQGTTFTLNGDPSMTFGLTAETNTQTTTTTWSGGMNGSIAWESGDRSGTCSVDLEYSGSNADQAVTFAMSGNVCGATISQSYSVG